MTKAEAFELICCLWIKLYLNYDVQQSCVGGTASDGSSQVNELPYSKEALYDGIYVISVEKAIACDDGRIIAICLRNDADSLCQPWDTPMIVTSFDGGKIWTKEK